MIDYVEDKNYKSRGHKTLYLLWNCSQGTLIYLYSISLIFHPLVLVFSNIYRFHRFYLSL